MTLDWFEREGIKVKFKKWISATAASLLLATSLIGATPAHADEVQKERLLKKAFLIYSLTVSLMAQALTIMIQIRKTQRNLQVATSPVY